MLKKLLVAILVVGMGSPAFAGNVTQVLGPQDPSQLNSIINTLIVSGNASWSPGGTSFLASNNISAISTATVSIGVALGPIGLSPTTPVEYLKIRNPSGTYRLIPMWGCTGC